MDPEMIEWVNIIYIISGIASIVCLCVAILFFFIDRDSLGQVFVIWFPVAAINLTLMVVKWNYNI